MKKLSTEQLIEIYKKLPKDLMDALFTVDTSSIIKNIGEKNRLTIDKTGEVANETGMVMMGITHPSEFITNLAMRLSIDKDLARAIAQDINEQVFRPVRDSLRKIHGITDGSEISAKVSPLEKPQRETFVSANFQGQSLDKPHREEILKEIEKDHGKDEVPDILKGSTNPFDVKMKEEVHQAPVEEKTYEEKPAPQPPTEKPKVKYAVDPYREPVE
ncbi:MAG: hypothetical protein L6Q29_02815 [Candidatus Pacebacteria bacterium]|nr:hypothetical protein [Candidatus Paceibacterota bacterium]